MPAHQSGTSDHKELDKGRSGQNKPAEGSQSQQQGKPGGEQQQGGRPGMPQTQPGTQPGWQQSGQQNVPATTGQPNQQRNTPPQQAARNIDDIERKRREDAQQLWVERSRDNNPATAKYREYSQMDQPGLDPANQPDPDSKLRKATRLDLEDLTTNPGHRGVNPDAPANSINPAPDGKGELPSINEPKGVPERPRSEVVGQGRDRSGQNIQRQGGPGKEGETGTGVAGSINEPPGSQVLPEGLQDGEANYGPGPGTGPNPPEGEDEKPTIESLDPTEAEVDAADITLHVHGSNFTEESIVTFDGVDEATEYVSDTELTATVEAAGVTAGAVPVTVKNGDQESEPIDFTFTEGAPASRGSRRK